MQSYRFRMSAAGRRIVLITTALSLASQVLVPTWALIPSFGKKSAALQVPTYTKLGEDAGPQTNDSGAVPDQSTTATSATSTSPAPSATTAPELAPVTLNSSSDTSSADNRDKDGVLKASVRENSLAPRKDSQQGEALAPKSITPTVKDKLFGEAKNVNVMPLPLQETREETEEKVETAVQAEKEQISELWDSTLTRSPDIQFVVQKLQPTSRPGHAQTIMMRMLSGALFGAMSAVGMMAPSAGMMPAQMGGGAVLSMLSGAEGAMAKKARLSQTEAIMLYTIVRNTADKLVDNFRNYKKSMIAFKSATSDLQDLQSMIRDARAGQDSSKQVEMEYTLRKAQRDVDAIGEDTRKYRQNLIDLAGTEAVAKLDKQVDDEQLKLNGTIATPEISPPPQPSPAPAENAVPPKPVTASENKPDSQPVAQPEAKPAVTPIASTGNQHNASQNTTNDQAQTAPANAHNQGTASAGAQM